MYHFSVNGALDIEQLLPFFQEGRNLVKCPHNEDHNVRSDRMEEHIKHCKLTSAGFTNVARKVST